MRAAIVALVVACQGQSADAPRQNVGSGSAPVPKPAAADAAAAPKEPDIDDLGAIPAWQAVVERAQYLARRGQHGVVYGAIGPAIDTYTWLVDDSEGNGALAVRVALGDRAAKVKPGDRVALGGAWALDDDHRWYWKVDQMSPLPPGPPPSKDPPAPPGHVIPNGDLPGGSKAISKAGDSDWAYFTVVGAPPALDGDGWPVADELGDPVVALLVLPGEHPSYGAQDMRAADERWHLKRGSTYVVRVLVVHHHGSDKPSTIVARTAPIKVM